MVDQPTNFSSTPDFLLGMDNGLPVLVPAGSSSAGPKGAEMGTLSQMATLDPTTGQLVSNGTVFGLTSVTSYQNISGAGTYQLQSGACELAGYDCTVAAGNITIYDNTGASGIVIVPTTALTVGRVEFAYKRALAIACTVVLSGAATVNVLVGV